VEVITSSGEIVGRHSPNSQITTRGKSIRVVRAKQSQMLGKQLVKLGNGFCHIALLRPPISEQSSRYHSQRIVWA
jgi:hypothetical protein